MALYIGQTQINSLELLQTWNKSLLGCVSNIRFSIIDSTLYVKWRDPDDSYQDGIAVAKFGGTKLMMKTGGYPENQDDGTMIVNSTIRNQYNDVELVASLPTYDEDVEYYFRFFSYDNNGNFNGDTQLGHQNRFSSLTYSWNQVVENLHNYETDSALVPAPGTVVNLKYMLDDYYMMGGNVKVALDTRQKVYDNRDKLRTVSIPWVVLGHNANVPQYIQYRRKNNQDEWESIFVSSVDDHTASHQIDLKDGTQFTANIDEGDEFQRDITAGCRTYSESWDLTANVHSYSDTGHAVESVSDTKFGYANQGMGTGNVYYAPKTITSNGKEWQFCGYTMTMQPINCLASNSTGEFFNSIQFDQNETLTANMYNLYPANQDAEKRYFFLKEGKFTEIDYISLGLGGTPIGPYVDGQTSCDVYLSCGERMKMQNIRFQSGRNYFRLNGTTEVMLTAGVDYTIGDQVPTSPVTYEKNNSQRPSGSNLYSESFFRKYCNNTDGSVDHVYEKSNPFDTESVVGLRNANSLLLKLFAEQEFISHIKRCSNITVIATPQRYYRNYRTSGSTYYECTQDLFWPLGYREVFGDGSDGSATFNAVYTNNNSRKKYALQANGSSAASPSNWWLRYPTTGTAHDEYNVNTTGSYNTNHAYNSYGFSPACLIA